ncbi:MAG: hypothetical protein COV07_04220 [Candidatus Vogelbacteria bacterium CG10_big_fil_rev_8_21_14_0_10_45_14]|uniref:Serine protease n=1 Tax=Candidatus Vogelbacteria bacterium CG10_big_fil_rev_8_21_14_0_10_45_14 TaxID=1975042 RepID=A0A2H0RIS1_9BACT|nr:MAG: hypothetical protein COV07_04220 [Candidatus Vogelbacteria bacterium CG10_big_fil_rev_8_21_14_0_10_45_14]
MKIYPTLALPYPGEGRTESFVIQSSLIMERWKDYKLVILVALLVVVSAEVYFVAWTYDSILRLRRDVAEMKDTLVAEHERSDGVAAELLALARRTDDIEKAAGVAIAGFKENLAKSEASRVKLEADLLKAERARELTELSRKADNLQASVALSALKQELSTSISENTLGEIIETWRPRIVRVSCRVGGSTSLGSGVLMRFADTPTGGVSVLTNSHVIFGGTSRVVSPTSCTITLPGSGSTATVFTSRKEIEVSADDALDFGRLHISSPSGAFQSAISVPADRCAETPKLGDTLLVLGYPSIGSEGDITATDGIISGFEDDYFITSAKVERGNSGGAAILVKENCMLGIPTFVRRGNIEALARILDIRSVQQ